MLFGVDAFVDALVLNNDNSGLCIGYHAARMLMGFDPIVATIFWRIATAKGRKQST